MNEKDPKVTTKDDGNTTPGDVVAGLRSSELVEIQFVRLAHHAVGPAAKGREAAMVRRLSRG